MLVLGAFLLSMTFALVTTAVFELRHQLKERIARQRVDGLRRGKKLDTDRVVARVQFAMAQHDGWMRGSGLCLRAERDLFTLTLRPFRQ